MVVVRCGTGVMAASLANVLRVRVRVASAMVGGAQIVGGAETVARTEAAMRDCI